MAAVEDTIEVRLMNGYGAELPLWLEDGLADPDELHLSGGLRADLTAFADRWARSVSPAVFDDRWDGVPVMQSLVAAKYALGRGLHPARQRAAQAEAEEMRSSGRLLSTLVQQELGAAYLVRYVD